MLGLFSVCAGCRQAVGFVAQVCAACDRSMHGGCRATAGGCIACGSGKPPRVVPAAGFWLGMGCAVVGLTQGRRDAGAPARGASVPPRASIAAPPAPGASAAPAPSPSPSPVATPSPGGSPAPSPSPSPSPVATPSPSPSPVATPSPSPSPVATPSPGASPSPEPLPLRTLANGDGGEGWAAVRANTAVVTPGEKGFVLEAHLRPGPYRKLLLELALNRTADALARRRIRVEVASGPGGRWERIPDIEVCMVSNWRWSTVRSPRPFDRVRLSFEDVAYALHGASRRDQALWVAWIVGVTDSDDRRADNVALEVERVDGRWAVLGGAGGRMRVPVALLESCVVDANRAYSAPDGSEGVVSLSGTPQLIPWPVDTNVHHLGLHLERYGELAPEERASWFWRDAFARALRDIEADAVVAFMPLPEVGGEVQISESGDVLITGETTATFSLAGFDGFLEELALAAASEVGMREFLSARVPRNWKGWTRGRPAKMARALEPLRARVHALLAATRAVRVGDRFSFARTNDVWGGEKALVAEPEPGGLHRIGDFRVEIPATLLPSGRGSLQLERVLRVPPENGGKPRR